MKKKIIGILIGMLLITTAVSTVESLNDNLVIRKAPSDNIQPCSLANWTEEQKLLASDGETGDEFSVSVALDGDTALIGAPGDNDNGLDSGSTYVFTRTGTTWTQQVKLNASDGAEGDNFGYSVSIDGDTALIGAPFDDDNGNWSGSAYVFTRTGRNWTQQAKLLASDGAADDLYGLSVSLSGETALIGAPLDNDSGENSGSVYVFKRTSSCWTQQTKLIASDATTNDYFGWSVSLDGDTALIGAPDDDTLKGSAYVFLRTGTTWTQQTKLRASDGSAFDEFGISVSLSGDTALIGAFKDDVNGDDYGSAYIFTRTDTTWTQQAKLLASDGSVYDEFGISVSLSGDTALIGAYCDDINEVQTGSAYVFIRTGTIWTQEAKIFASDRTKEDYFGSDVTLDGNTALIGAYHNNYYKGKVYVFTRSNQPPVNHEPNKPSTPEGSTNGKINADYIYVSITHDPEGDNVYYFWDWGDGNNSGWIGPSTSGVTSQATHNWSKKGNYAIKVKAKDVSGHESVWSDSLPITMPYSYKPILEFLKMLFQWFPYVFLLLQQPLGY